jgi:hypothetical protein
MQVSCFQVGVSLMLQSKRADSLKNEMKDSGYNTNTNNVSLFEHFNLQISRNGQFGTQCSREPATPARSK